MYTARHSNRSGKKSYPVSETDDDSSTEPTVGYRTAGSACAEMRSIYNTIDDSDRKRDDSEGIATLHAGYAGRLLIVKLRQQNARSATYLVRAVPSYAGLVARKTKTTWGGDRTPGLAC